MPVSRAPHLPSDFLGRRAFARSRKDGSIYLGASETISSNPDMNPFLFRFTVLPGCLCFHLIDEKPHPLIVRRVQPEHPIKDVLGLVKAPKTPEAQAKAMHASVISSIISSKASRSLFPLGLRRFIKCSPQAGRDGCRNPAENTIKSSPKAHGLGWHTDSRRIRRHFPHHTSQRRRQIALRSFPEVFSIHGNPFQLP
jgi:hypothetical protein